jgi:hypothetical protein
VLAASLDAAESYQPLESGERDLAMAAMADEQVIFPLAEQARLPWGPRPQPAGGLSE